jgi:glycosyltransferase involved in cell wall biosynthesis
MYLVIHDPKPTDAIHLVWIFSGSLAITLDAGTWLFTVQELRNSGWKVTLVATGDNGYHQIHGVEVLCIPRPEVYLIRQAVFHLKALQFVLRHWATIDMILFHEISAPWILPLRFVRLLTGKRRPILIMDTRTLPMIPLSKEKWKDRIRRTFNIMTKHIGNYWADGRTAITERMAESLHIPEEKLWGVWPSGVDPNQFIKARDSHKWPSADEPVHLIYIGVLNYERNLLTFCHSVEKANAEGMAFKLTIVGEGTEQEDLERFSQGASGSIRVEKPVPHDKVPELLGKAHIGILPFPDEEKFRVSSPIKLFEYMAAGLPILVTRIVCHTDVVGSGEYAFWAEDASEQGLFNALRMVWQSRDLLSGMGQQAALAAHEWTWKASAEKLKKALEKGFQSLESPKENISP